jgi:hypothetical protein
MNQEQWLKTRKHLLETVKNQVHARLGPPSRSLKNYSKRLQEEFQKEWRKSSLDQLAEECGKADLLFLSDFHAYYQSQRAHLRLLRGMDLEQGAVFMECFRENDAQAIDLFWKDGLSEAEFLKRVKWSSSWGFPWEHYRDLVLHLKSRGVLVRGLSAGAFYDQRLKGRDRKMARIIEKELLKHPCRKVVVIAGEMHLHKEHLPLEVEKLSRLAFRKRAVVFQDNEDLYFRLQKKFASWEPTVLRKEDSFCWNVSPPWVKWQSYLIYLEKTADQELEEEDFDHEDHIKAFVHWMGSDLGLSVSFNRLEVVTPRVRRLKSKIPPELLRELVFSERSFFLDPFGKIYLSRLSVNHAASMAGQYIHNQLSQRKKLFYDLPRDLERRLWIETVGFFFSKWMNPSRKTETFEAFKIRLGALDTKGTSAETMKLVSEIFIHSQRVKRGLSSKLSKKRMEKKQLLFQLEAIRFLGRVFGKALFEGVLSRRISREELLFWLLLPLEREDFSKTFWEGIVPRLI